MGRSSRSMKKKFKQDHNKNIENDGKKNGELSKELLAELEVIRAYKDKGEYNEALEVVIKTFEEYGIQGRTAYEAAEVYYLCGDYERTAIWCEKTLAEDSDNVEAFLLLAKVALLKDQLENVLALLEKIIIITSHDFEVYKEQMDELLRMVLIDYDEEQIKHNYPSIWNSLCNQPENDLEDSIGENIMDGTNQANHDKKSDVSDVQAEIMAMPVSLMGKINLCHDKANEYYKDGNLDAALEILKLAMAIDNTNDLTLKNMGFVLLELGNKEEARACFTHMKNIDLMVIKLMK